MLSKAEHLEFFLSYISSLLKCRFYTILVIDCVRPDRPNFKTALEQPNFTCSLLL